MTKDTKYLLLLATIYFVVSLVGILHHELWLDEAQHWLLARDSNSVAELMQNTRFEGHPIIWDLILFGVTRVTLNPFWMQFFHIIISTTTVVVFLKKAPFDWLFKTLFIFGYFMVFEYNLISRNYMLGTLFLFLACAIFKNRQLKFTWLSLCLAMALNAHLLFGVVALALFLLLLTEQIKEKEFFKKQYLAGYSIFALGILLLAIQIQATNPEWLLEPIQKLSFKEKMVDGFASFFKGIITIPDFRTIHFWNSNLIINLFKPLVMALALLVYFLPLLFFKNRKTLFFVYLALIGLQVFFFVTQRTATRFHGMGYLLLIIGLWMDNLYNANGFKWAKFQKPAIYIILLLQLGSGIWAYSMDIIYPFSLGKEAAVYLKHSKLDRDEIVSVSCEGTVISAYMQKKVYFLSEGGYRGYCNWDSGNFSNINGKTIIEMLSRYVDSKNYFIYVSTYPIASPSPPYMWTPVNDKVMICFLKSFKEGILRNGNYYVYQVAKNKVEL